MYSYQKKILKLHEQAIKEFSLQDEHSIVESCIVLETLESVMRELGLEGKYKSYKIQMLEYLEKEGILGD